MMVIVKMTMMVIVMMTMMVIVMMMTVKIPASFLVNFAKTRVK